MWYTVPMTRYKYNFTREQIEDAAQSSSTKTEMMQALKIKQGGGGYQALDFWCRKYDVTPPTMSWEAASKRGRGTGKGFKRMPDEEWFVNGIRRQGPDTRKRLIRNGVPDECSICGIGPEWNGKSLTLQIDHIDGDRWNNLSDNVRILCPNCHTQTDTYANTGAEKRRHYCECGAEIRKESTVCQPCARKASRKIEWPEIREVVDGVKSSNFSRYAASIGVTDNAVRAYMRKNGVDPKRLDLYDESVLH